VTPVLAGIWTAISEVVDTPPFDQADFQRQLVLALIGLIAFVSVADIFCAVDRDCQDGDAHSGGHTVS
jgi:hypothetical protein